MAYIAKTTVCTWIGNDSGNDAYNKIYNGHWDQQMVNLDWFVFSLRVLHMLRSFSTSFSLFDN